MSLFKTTFFSSMEGVGTSAFLRSIPIVRSVCNQLEIYLFAQSNQRCMSNKLIQTTKTNKVTPEKLVSQGTKSTYNCFSIKGKVARGFKQCILYYYYLSVKRILVFSLFGLLFLPFHGPNWPPTRAMVIFGATDSTAKECTSEVANNTSTFHDLHLMCQS